MRNSSVELFRIISTFLVLIVHFNGWFISIPSKFVGFSIFSVTQDFIESFSIICVNCFLVITGWYGITFKWKHIWTIYSILVWIYVPCYLLDSYITDSFSILKLIGNIIAFCKESYYVQCYLMLLFLSPILNSFIKKFNKRILPYTIAFWSIEIVFDWILGNKCLGFGRGFEITHFILMYLLGRTAYIYRDYLRERLSNKLCILNCFVGILIIMVMYFFLNLKYSFSYSNPFNVIMAFSLFFLFERKVFYNKFIDSIGRSTLAVYILHITPPVFNYLCWWDNYCLKEFNYGIYLILMASTILIVFMVGILYDKIKDLFMPNIGKIICNWLELKTRKYIDYFN